jgi:predicted TIM-barrel fold metal-dependent hydrolase
MDSGLAGKSPRPGMTIMSEETMTSYPLIDIYCHIYPEKFFEEMTKLSPQTQNLGKRLRTITKLFDLGERFREMDQFGHYRQIISLPNPPIEEIASGEAGLRLARIGNDAMAELCARHPDRFAGFVAAMSLTEVEGSVAEASRAVTQLGACGVQVFTPLAGRPLDGQAFAPVFAAMAEFDLPIWLHPARTAAMTDYAAEAKSRYEMWWCFGWPYDTSVAMSRLVFSGLFDRHPGIKIITHHCGGMIPYFDGRVGPGLDVLGARTTGEDYSQVLALLKRPHLEYFKEFYGDTAMFGGKYGIPCGLEFFGADHIVFATDTPLGPIAPTMAVIDDLDIDDEARRKIYVGNAERLVKRKLA